MKITKASPKKENFDKVYILRHKYNETFQKLIKYDDELPKEISSLTGISKKMLREEGQDIREVLFEFIKFIGDLPLVGYNLKFDVEFINHYLKKYGMQTLTNKKIDILPHVKKEKIFLSSYKLENVLQAYEIYDKVAHRALDDANLIYKLSTKMNGFTKNLNHKD